MLPGAILLCELDDLQVGLQGTGDSLRSSPFTEQSMRAMLENLGVSTRGGQSRLKMIEVDGLTDAEVRARLPAD